MHNPNCDGSRCTKPNGQVRVLPSGGDSNLILCMNCYLHEMAFRIYRNLELNGAAQFDIPTWQSLKIYGEDNER